MRHFSLLCLLACFPVGYSLSAACYGNAGTISLAAGDYFLYTLDYTAYTDSITCSVSLQAPPGTYLRLDFEMELVTPSSDRILVFDGPDATGQPLNAMYPQFKVFATIYTSGRDATVVFISDEYPKCHPYDRDGFVLNATVVPVTQQHCSGINNMVNVVGSTSYSEPQMLDPLDIPIYYGNTQCGWRFTAPPGLHVVLDAYSPPNGVSLKPRDSFTAYDGDDSSAPLMNANSGEYVFYSTGRSLYVLFTSVSGEKLGYTGIAFTVKTFDGLDCSKTREVYFPYSSTESHWQYPFFNMNQEYYTNCSWLFTSDPGVSVQIVVELYSNGAGPVVIYRGNSTHSTNSLSVYDASFGYPGGVISGYQLLAVVPIQSGAVGVCFFVSTIFRAPCAQTLSTATLSTVSLLSYYQECPGGSFSLLYVTAPPSSVWTLDITIFVGLLEPGTSIEVVDLQPMQNVSMGFFTPSRPFFMGTGQRALVNLTVASGHLSYGLNRPTVMFGAIPRASQCSGHTNITIPSNSATGTFNSSGTDRYLYNNCSWLIKANAANRVVRLHFKTVVLAPYHYIRVTDGSTGQLIRLITNADGQGTNYYNLYSFTMFMRIEFNSTTPGGTGSWFAYWDSWTLANARNPLCDPESTKPGAFALKYLAGGFTPNLNNLSCIIHRFAPQQCFGAHLTGPQLYNAQSSYVMYEGIVDAHNYTNARILVNCVQGDCNDPGIVRSLEGAATVILKTTDNPTIAFTNTNAGYNDCDGTPALAGLCSGTVRLVNSVSGTLSVSNNLYGPFRPGQTCQWIVSAPPGCYLYVQISWNYLSGGNFRFHDGLTDQGPIIADGITPQMSTFGFLNFVILSGNMFVNFTAKSNGTPRTVSEAIYVTYSAPRAPIFCEAISTVNVSIGAFSDIASSLPRSSSNPYLPNHVCVFIVRCEGSCRLQLLAHSLGDGDDTTEVFDGPDTSSPRLSIVNSGQPQYRSSGAVAVVRFTSGPQVVYDANADGLYIKATAVAVPPNGCNGVTEINVHGISATLVGTVDPFDPASLVYPLILSQILV